MAPFIGHIAIYLYLKMAKLMIKQHPQDSLFL